MIFQIYRGSLQDAMILNDENLTVGGKVIAGTVPRMYTSSDRGYFVAGTNDASNQHLYLGSYHGSTLKELTFSGSNNAFYPQTSAAIDLGLSTKSLRTYICQARSSGAIASSGQLTLNSTGSSNAIVAKTGSLINSNSKHTQRKLRYAQIRQTSTSGNQTAAISLEQLTTVRSTYPMTVIPS